MANINELFEVQTGLKAGSTTISSATGDISAAGNVTVTKTLTVGSVVIDPTTNNISTSGAITATGNITSTTGSIVLGSTVISGSSQSFSNIVVSGGSINGTPIGATTASTGKFSTLQVTGTTTVSGTILPSSNNTIDIGSPTARFGNIYVNEARLSTNTLYLGDTPILGTDQNVVQIHADPGQAIHMQTSGAAGTLAFVSNAQVTMQTTGNNADVLIQSNGTGAKTRILSGTQLELTAPTISAAGNVGVTGTTTTQELIVNGNLTVTGSQANVNADELTVKDNIVIVNSAETGEGVTVNGGTAGFQINRGQLTSYRLVFRESDDSLQFGPVGATTKVVVENGSGQIVGNITGSAATAATAATVTSAAQPAITSVGTLTSLTTSGDAVIGGNLTVNGTTTTVNAATLDVADLNITVAKNAATAAAANGAGLTIAGANATMLYGNTNDNFTFNKRVDATSFYGSGAGLTSIPNSALTNSSVTVTAGSGMSGGGTVSLGGSVTLTNAGVTQLTGGGGISVSGATGAITLGSTATSANTASAIVARDAAGNFTAGTITATLNGTAGLASSIAGGGAYQVPFQTATSSTSFVAAGTTGQVLTATTGGAPTWQTHTDVDSIAVSGVGLSVNQSTGPVTITSNATSANTASTIVARDASGNFSAGVITATATNARYADLAENYAADAEYEPGTVVCFGGEAEVTLCDVDGYARIAGVVSTAPAYVMNCELEGVKAAVALQGRVPVKVVGAVRKGDMMVAAGNGAARAEANPKIGTVIGKALENFNGDTGVIEVVVGRL